MQKKDIIELIKFHTENDEASFRNKAYGIANYFERNGDAQLGEYIMTLMSGENAFTPQMQAHELKYFKEINREVASILLPDDMLGDINGAIFAIDKKIGINKILFEGAPGTGKTETAIVFARALGRKLYSVNFNEIIDSKLGQTAKNIADMFNEIKLLANPDKVLILFDEIDAIALDRINGNDLREMGRVTSALLKELDELNESTIIIATTNLFSNLDKALIRRFDSIINFDRYSKSDMAEIAVSILNQLSAKIDNIEKNTKLLKKIVKASERDVSPGELRNIIKTSVAFSNPDNPSDYLGKIAQKLNIETGDIKKMKTSNFTVREISAITGSSKTQVGRCLTQ